MNPIPFKFRGWFYVIAAILGIVGASVSQILQAFGVPAVWQSVEATSLSAILAVLGTLSRANLTPDPLSAPTQVTAPTTPSTTEATPVSGA